MKVKGSTHITEKAYYSIKQIIKDYLDFGLNNKEIAKRIGISQATYHKIKRTENYLQFQMINRKYFLSRELGNE